MAAISQPESIASLMGEPAGSGVRGGAESPSLSDDEEYQKLDSEALWQQAQKGDTAAGESSLRFVAACYEAGPEFAAGDEATPACNICIAAASASGCSRPWL